MANEKLQEYLLGRELLDPAQVVDIATSDVAINVRDAILEDNETLARVAGMWESNRSALEKVLKVRILDIAVNLLVSAKPEETIVLRQVMLELAEVLKDFEKYHTEFTKRAEK